MAMKAAARVRLASVGSVVPSYESGPVREVRSMNSGPYAISWAVNCQQAV